VAVAKRNPAGEPNVEAVGPFTFCGKLELDSCASAVMIRNALCVDPELRQDQVTRSLTVEGSTIHMCMALLSATVPQFFFWILPIYVNDYFKSAQQSQRAAKFDL